MPTQTKHEETEENKYRICQYLKNHKDVIASKIGEELGLTKNQLTHYLNFLHYRNHVAKYVRQTATGRHAIYNIGRTPFVKKLKNTVEHVKETPIVPHARVIRLTDRHYLYKDAPKKRTSGSKFVSIGSGMAMFGNW